MTDKYNPDPVVGNDANADVVSNNDRTDLANDDAKKLTADQRRHFKLYTMMNRDVLLGLLKQIDWNDYLSKQEFWKIMGKSKPKQILIWTTIMRRPLRMHY